MSIIEDLKEMFIRHARTRNVPVPTREQGVILYDDDGAERLVALAKHRRQNNYVVASVKDFLNFLRDMPLRYPEDVKIYRELCVTVDRRDVPNAVIAALPHDDPRDGQVSFGFVQHEDFTRWFDGKKRSQTEFRRMLIELDGQHDCQTLAQVLSFLEYKTEVTFEASSETERTYVLGYKEKESKSGLNIPKVINVKCPVISGTAYIVDVTFDIVIKRPTAEDPKIMFHLVPAGKDPVKILRDASIIVAEHELLQPAIEILKANGVEVVNPLYVRESVAVTTIDEQQKTYTL